jgi:hypothetical protein
LPFSSTIEIEMLGTPLAASILEILDSSWASSGPADVCAASEAEFASAAKMIAAMMRANLFARLRGLIFVRGIESIPFNYAGNARAEICGEPQML